MLVAFKRNEIHKIEICFRLFNIFIFLLTFDEGTGETIDFSISIVYYLGDSSFVPLTFIQALILAFFLFAAYLEKLEDFELLGTF